MFLVVLYLIRQKGGFQNVFIAGVNILSRTLFFYPRSFYVKQEYKRFCYRLKYRIHVTSNLLSNKPYQHFVRS